MNQIYNNAGIAFLGDVEVSDFKDIERVIDVDFWGVVNGTKAFLPHLIASGNGHVVNISSMFGLFGMHGQAPYHAAKFAVRGFTEALRQEMRLAGHPVKVICVHPGYIKTDIARNTSVGQGVDTKALDRHLRQAREHQPATRGQDRACEPSPKTRHGSCPASTPRCSIWSCGLTGSGYMRLLAADPQTDLPADALI